MAAATPLMLLDTCSAALATLEIIWEACSMPLASDSA